MFDPFFLSGVIRWSDVDACDSDSVAGWNTRIRVVLTNWDFLASPTSRSVASVPCHIRFRPFRFISSLPLDRKVLGEPRHGGPRHRGSTHFRATDKVLCPIVTIDKVHRPPKDAFFVFSILLFWPWYAPAAIVTIYALTRSYALLGFGHATRVSAFARHLLSLQESHTVYLISSAPRHVFATAMALGAIYRNAEIDPVILQPLAFVAFSIMGFFGASDRYLLLPDTM